VWVGVPARIKAVLRLWRLKYHCHTIFWSVRLTTKPHPIAPELSENPVLTEAKLKTGERAFLAQGAAAGAKARETGFTISTEQSILRLKALTVQRASTSKP
jgi:hypothetical protein